MSLPALSISIQQANITIFQSSLRGNTIMVDMSASRLCVVRVTDRTVCSQCDHELASLVYIVACFNCMCELMCVRIFFKGGFLFEVNAWLNYSITMNRVVNVVVHPMVSSMKCCRQSMRSSQTYIEYVSSEVHDVCNPSFLLRPKFSTPTKIRLL
jgi:hypothetical protein